MYAAAGDQGGAGAGGATCSKISAASNHILCVSLAFFIYIYFFLLV